MPTESGTKDPWTTGAEPLTFVIPVAAVLDSALTEIDCADRRG